MPRYRITEDDGTVHEIDGPEGASRQQVIAAIQADIANENVNKAEEDYEQYLATREEVEPEEGDEDTTAVGNIGRGIISGAVGLAEMAALGAITPLNEETELSARDIIKTVADFAKPRLANPEEVTAKFSEGLGSFAGLAGVAAIPFVGLPAAIALGAGAGAGEASERAREGGATQEERNLATRFGVGVGASEFISPLRIVKALKGGLGEEAATGFIAAAKRVAKEAGIEGLQEFAAGVGQNLIEQNIYNPQQGTFEDSAEQFGYGAGIGGFVRTVVELITPRRIGGPSAPAQGELFDPDADLGVVPPAAVAPEQGELFSDEDLGRAPEEDTQLDLFGPAGSPEAGLRQRIRDLELERQRAVQSPMAPFEEGGDPFFERTDAEILQAREQLAALTGRVEPEQQELQFESVPGADAEQVAQASARERAALTAIERGDETAFEQPDLFALQQEQEKRRLGIFPPDQFMDEPLFIEGQEDIDITPTSEVGPQLELEDVLVSDAETTQLEEMVAADETLRAESELETIGGQLDTQQQQETAAKRGAVLDSVLTDLRSDDPAITIKRFSRDLKKAGIARTAPTGPELRAINSAASVAGAVSQEVAPEVIEPRQQYQMREDAEGTRRRAPQTEVPFVPERGATEAEPIITPPPVEDPLIASAEGDVSAAPVDPLTASAEGDVSAASDQMELFGDTITFAEADNVTQRTDTGPTGPVPIGPAIEMAAESLRKGKVKPKPKTEGEAAAQAIEVGDTVQATAEDGTLLLPKPVKVVGVMGELDGVVYMKLDGVVTGYPIDRLELVEKGEPAAKPKKPAAKKAAAKPKTETPAKPKPKPKTETPAKPKPKPKYTGPVRTEAEIAEMERRSPYGFMAEVNKQKLRLDPETGTSTYNVEEDIVPDEDPLSAQDKENIAELLEEGTTARDLNGISARAYLSNFNTPIEGIASAIYDVVYKTPQWSGRERGMSKEQRASLGEKYRGTGLEFGERTLAWAERNLSPETNAWIAKEEVRIAKQRQQELDLAASRTSVLVGINIENDLRKQKIRDEQAQIAQENLEANKEDANKLRKQLNKLNDALQKRMLEIDAVVGLDLPAHPAVRSALADGNLPDALALLATTSPSSRVSQVARTLAQKLGDTKVEVVENLTDDAGKPAAGLFDPKTNTIKVDAATGINPHTILHETTHALTSATLANKSHPVTKQLEKLFNDVKDELGSVYGSQNVDEFVAEAFGSPEFQQTLAGINPNGSPISALQRFFNTVGNFVRRMLGMQTKPVDSALNQADQFIEAMLAPAPQYRGAGEMYLKTPSEYMDGLNKVGKSFPKLTPAYRKRWANSARNFLSVDNPARKLASTILLTSAPLQALTDVATTFGIKSSFKLHVAIQTLVGKQALAEARVDGTLKSMGKWLHGSSTTDAKRQSFNNLIYDSTTEQVDPYALESKYAGNKKKLAVWKAMRGDVSIIGTGGRDTYIELRDSYKSQFEELQRVIGGRIDALRDENGDPLAKEAREKLKTNVFDKIFAKGRIEPYFPLTRQGDLWLEFNTKVTAADNTVTTEPVYMAFRTDYERKQFIASLKNNKDVVGTPVPYKNMKSAITGARGNAPNTSFINQTMELLKGVDADVQNQFMELFLNALPESSFARSMVSRGNQGKGQLGFDTDAESAFRSKAYNLASQIERMRHSQNIDDVMAEIENETKAISKAGKAGAGATMATFEELQKRAAFAKNPPPDKIAASFNRVAFLGTIGFNVSSAIVNMSQIPLMMQPLLGGTYGQKNAAKALFHAGALISGSAKYGRKMTTMLGKEADAKGMPSIDNYYQEIQTLDADKNPVFTLKIRDDLKLDAAKRKELEELMPLVQMAASQGQLSRSLFYDTLGVELSGREKGAWDYTNAMSAFMFHQVERGNRQIALVSTYQLELARLKAKGGMTDAAMQDAAAQTAIYKSQEMNGGAFLASAPRIAQSGVGRVAMMYKTFGIQMYYTILKTGKAALSDADPEIRKQAMKQLVGVLGSSALLAGVQGLPMIGAVFALANLFLDDDEEDAETITRQFMGEGFYKGGVNALTGLDVANRFGLGNLLFRMNPYSQNQSSADIAAQIIGGPAWSVGSQFVRGLSDASSGELQRGIETMLPSAFRNVAKTIRYGEEGAIKSRRGDIIYDDISSGELMGQLFGFAPTGYTLQQEKNMSTKKIDRAVNERRTGILRKLYIALRMDDSSGYEDAFEDLQDFNRRHPSFSLTAGSVMKSIQTHGRTSATMYNGITISPKMRGVLQEHRDSYSE